MNVIIHCYYVDPSFACRNCPMDLKEAISSVIFASPRCSDIPELVDVKKHFTAKYGKEFVSAAVELRSECGVNRLASLSYSLLSCWKSSLISSFLSNLVLCFSWLRNCLPEHQMVQPKSEYWLKLQRNIMSDGNRL